MFKVNHLSKTIHSKNILNDLNFEIGRGEIAIFLGESGVGKSTLLRVINNLENYDKGSFSLDGLKLNLTTQSHTVGMVFQHFNLFEHLTAEDNIILTLTKSKGLNKKEAKQMASRLLERYGLQDKAKTITGRLSGGQKQRLAIARTLAIDPKVICLDEPTSALDPRLTSQVAKFITELAAENRIILLATHDMNLLEQLDGKLFLMEGGSILKPSQKMNGLSSRQPTQSSKTFCKVFDLFLEKANK